MQVEIAELLVVGRHFALALEHLDGNRGLPVIGGGEHLAFLGRDGGVAVDQPGKHAAEGFNAEAERGDI